MDPDLRAFLQDIDFDVGGDACSTRPTSYQAPYAYPVAMVLSTETATAPCADAVGFVPRPTDAAPMSQLLWHEHPSWLPATPSATGFATRNYGRQFSERLCHPDTFLWVSQTAPTTFDATASMPSTNNSFSTPPSSKPGTPWPPTVEMPTRHPRGPPRHADPSSDATRKRKARKNPTDAQREANKLKCRNYRLKKKVQLQLPAATAGDGDGRCLRVDSPPVQRTALFKRLEIARVAYDNQEFESVIFMIENWSVVPKLDYGDVQNKMHRFALSYHAVVRNPIRSFVTRLLSAESLQRDIRLDLLVLYIHSLLRQPGMDVTRAWKLILVRSLVQVLEALPTSELKRLGCASSRALIYMRRSISDLLDCKVNETRRTMHAWKPVQTPSPPVGHNVGRETATYIPTRLGKVVRAAQLTIGNLRAVMGGWRGRFSDSGLHRDVVARADRRRRAQLSAPVVHSPSLMPCSATTSLLPQILDDYFS